MVGKPHICGMEKILSHKLSHKEAWQDFYKWMEVRRDSREINQIPKDVQEAKYAAEGLRPSRLGEKRIKNLLRKYAPDRYEFREGVILHE